MDVPIDTTPGSSFRSDRSDSARVASRPPSTTTPASRSRSAWPTRVVAAAGAATDRDRVERARGRAVVRRARARASRRSRLARRARPTPDARWTLEHGLDRVVVVHGDLPFATTLDDVAGDGAAAIAVLVPIIAATAHPVLCAAGRRAVRVRLRRRLVRATLRRSARASASRCGSCATTRSASTSTSPRISARLESPCP